MLTGKPPFQSTTADEIYRRARERDYDWPKLDTSENFISGETKELVSDLLEWPERRPDADTIVQHPFFTCGWMPQSEEMTPELRHSAPSPTQFLSVGVRAGRANLYARNLKKLCIKCEVGPWNGTTKAPTSTYREVTNEEKAGLTPAVPLPEDVVYRPFHEWLKEEADRQNGIEEASENASELLDKMELLPAQVIPSNGRPTTQSFAAQQRARGQGSCSSSRSGNPRKTSSELRAGQKASHVIPASGSRPLLTIPNRHVKLNSQRIEPRISEKVPEVEDRLAADMVEQLNKADAERRSRETKAPVLVNPVSLFNPRERVEAVSGTKPDQISQSLQQLQAELERALNSRTIAVQTKTTPPTPTIVVKWVDYTNKFGLGYILSNGSVGCIFKATAIESSETSKEYIPPSCIVVRDAERHLQNRNNEEYIDRYQLVPISGPNIEFYENRGEQGVLRGKVNPQNYKVPVSKSGEIGKLARGQDAWDDRKREKIMLWKKFANYMTAYGRDQDYPYDDALARTAHDPESEFVAAGNVVTFYQRFGDVGCWAFCDGHYQVHFPISSQYVCPFLLTRISSTFLITLRL
jgi:hypothetical protein